MTTTGDAPHIKSLLRANAEALARTLLPDGRRSANYWLGARNPSRQDTTPGSFWVWIGGERAGGWCDAASGQKGDVFGLIELCVGTTTFPDTLRWARGFLGLADVAQGELARRAKAAAVDAPTAAQAAADEARKLEIVRSRFRAAKVRPFAGSPADTYLRTRGIDLRVLGRQPGIIGWLPSARHIESGRTWPAMIAGFQAGGGQIVALHTTFLAEDGSGKAPVTPVRKIWPSFAGAVMRVWRGGSGMREDEAAQNGLLDTLVLTEGVEDALSVALARPDWRVWAAGSLGNLGNVRLPACTDRVIVCADNDWGKPQAAQQLSRAVAALVAQGIDVAVARSPVGKDVNDCLRGNR